MLSTLSSNQIINNKNANNQIACNKNSNNELNYEDFIAQYGRRFYKILTLTNQPFQD